MMEIGIARSLAVDLRELHANAQNMQDGDLTDILLKTLRRRLEVVADREWYARDAAGHLLALQEVSAELTSLSADAVQLNDPTLQHYLEKQSYVKAVAHLEARLEEVP